MFPCRGLKGFVSLLGKLPLDSEYNAYSFELDYDRQSHTVSVRLELKFLIKASSLESLLTQGRSLQRCPLYTES